MFASVARKISPLLVGAFRSASISSLSKHGNVLGGANMSPAALATFEAWHSSVSAVMNGEKVGPELTERMENHVADSVKFYPPTYYDHWEGKGEFIVLIACVSQVFGKSFVYDRQFVSDDGKDWW